MRVSFEFTTAVKEDIRILGVLGTFLSEDLENCCGDNEQPVQQIVETTNESKPKTKRARKAKKDEPVASEEIESSPAEEPVAVEELTAAEKEDAMEKEEPVEVTEEKEVTEEPVEIKVAPMVNKCTAEEWREILKQKNCELGIAKMIKTGDRIDIVEGPRANLKSELNDFIHKLSESYGNRIPSKLSDEVRYNFVDHFKRIAYDEATRGFIIDGAPF